MIDCEVTLGLGTEPYFMVAFAVLDEVATGFLQDLDKLLVEALAQLVTQRQPGGGFALPSNAREFRACGLRTR